MRILLLPGMDGTGTLFAPLVEELSGGPHCEIVAYDRSQYHASDVLVEQVSTRLAASEAPTVIVAESFSGPLAVRVAAAKPPQLRGLVLAASFARAPLPSWLRAGVGAWMFAVPPPRWAVRRFLVGPEASDGAVDVTLRAIASVEPAVMAGRLRAILSVDVLQVLEDLTIPVRYIVATQDRLIGQNRAFGNARFQDVHEVVGPHCVLQSCPTECARLIEGAVADLQG